VVRNSEITADTFTQDTRVGVVWLTPCSKARGCKKDGSPSHLAQFAPTSADGLIVYAAIMSAHKDLSAALDQASAIEPVKSRFLLPVQAALQDKGMQATVQEQFVYSRDAKQIGKHRMINLHTDLKEQLPEESIVPGRSQMFEFDRDLSSVATALNADVLAVLDLRQFGVLRDFLPFGVPATYPYAQSVARVYLVDVETGNLLFNEYGASEIDIGSDWNQVGDWSNALTATRNALDIAIDNATKPLLDALSTQ